MRAGFRQKPPLRIRLFLLACTALVCGGSAVALDPSLDVSQYAHTAWKISAGFATGTIRAITQTPDGYLWLGSELGLFRFDGVRAVPWQPPEGEHLPSSLVRRLLVSRDGTLWIGTDKGLASWKDGKLTRYPDIHAQRIDALVEDRDRTIWVGVETVPSWELCAIRNANVECYGKDGSLGLGVGTLFEDGSGNLWAGTGTGLWHWKPGAPKRIPLSGLASEVHGIAQGNDSALLIATRAGLLRLVGGKVAPYPLSGTGSPFNPYWLLLDRHGGLWIGTTDRGIFHVHQGRTDQFTQPDGLSSDTTGDLFEDREGNVWTCTNDGLDRFREYAITTIPVKQGLAASYVESVLTSRDGTVWVGTRNGLDRWDAGLLTLYRKRRARVPETVRQIIDTGLPDDFQGSLLQDHGGRIWFFSVNGAAYLENDQFIPARAMPGGYAHSIAEDPARNLWISQDQGLFRMLPDRVVERIPWVKLGQHGLALALAADPLQGGLWLGFSEGGLAYFKDGQVRASYGAGDGLSDGRVNALQINRDGTLWVATEGGLSRVKNGGIITLSNRNGLPCESIHDLMEDETHSLWLFMACGLAHIARPDVEAWIANPRRTIEAEILDNSDGLRSGATPDGLSPRVTKSADGTMWYASEGHIFVIDPRRLRSSVNKLLPPVHIEQVIADGKTYWQNLSANALSSRPHLPPLLHDLTINYTALSLVAPEKVHFRFKLEGQDKDWREVVNEREVQYSNLGPKAYRFLIKACNNSGVWNEEGAALDFVIPPTWYQTYWFGALCVAAFLALLWALYQLRLRELAHQFNVRLEERVSERTRIARELHDTLLQSFQGLVFRFQAARYQLPNRPEEACETLDSALVSADQALAEGRSSIQELRSEPLKESDMEHMLLGLGRELASSQNGEHSVPPLRVIVEGTRRAKQAMIREEIYLIARELLRNAYRHAHARSIEAELRYVDSAFVLIVRDDGKGIDPQVLKDRGRAGHWGLRGIYERAEGIGARLDVWSEAGAGTEVRLTVPGAIAYEQSGHGLRFRLFRKTRIYEHRP